MGITNLDVSSYAKTTARLKIVAIPRCLPDGSPYLGLFPDAASRLAIEVGIDLLQVELIALDVGIIPERYSRNCSSLSLEAQRALLTGRVCLVGLGGIGGIVLELLARLGVGHILVADGEVFEVSNLNRQFLGTIAWLDRPKVAAACERVKAVNPAIELVVLDTALDAYALDELLPDVDVVVDALGDLSGKRMLATVAQHARRPLVTAAVAGWNGYVATVLPGQRLPTGFTSEPFSGIAADQVLGCLAPTVALAASLQATAVVALLTTPYTVASSTIDRELEFAEVLLFDALHNSFSRLASIH